MRQAAQPFLSAALSANRFSGGVLGLYDGGQRHDQSGDDDVVGMTIDALERLLFGVECEPKISVLKVFGLGKARTENVRHDGRFDKQMLHNFPRTGEVYSSLMRANHCPKSDTSYKLPVCCTESQLVTHNGKCATNAPNTLGIAKAANDLTGYPKITIADFDIPHSSQASCERIMTDSASIKLPPRRVAVQIRHREPAGYLIRLGERAGDSNSLSTLTGSAFSICYNLPAPYFPSTAVSSENLGSVVAAVPPFGMRRLAARTLERSGPNTVGARALAAIFSRGQRLISNFCRPISAAGKPAFLPLVHDANQPTRGFFKSFKVSKVLSFPAAVHDVNLAAEPKSVRQ